MDENKNLLWLESEEHETDETTAAEEIASEVSELAETELAQAEITDSSPEPTGTMLDIETEIRKYVSSYEPEVTVKAVKEESVNEIKPISSVSSIPVAAEQVHSGVKKRSNWKKVVAVASLAAVLGGSTMGLGLAAGNVISERYFQQTEAVNSQVQTEAFAFSNGERYGTYGNVAPLAAITTGVSIVDVVKDVSDSVVSINVMAPVPTYFGQTFDAAGAGSGIIFHEDEENVYIATNNHVIDGAKSVTISLDDETQISASPVGKQAESDIAVISVSKKDLQDAGISYKLANIADTKEIEVGEPVLAIGNAMGEGKTVTMGIVSAKNKQINISSKTLDVIQTDAAINSGNSGGPLVNLSGEVIGINTAKLASSGVEGMGYSIPMSEAKKIIDGLVDQNGPDAVQKPYLGVGCADVTEDIKKMYNIAVDGVLVTQVAQDSTAYNAGVQPGDVIVGLGNEKIANFEGLVETLGKMNIGDKVKIYVYRNGNTPVVMDAVIAAASTGNRF